MAIKQKTKRINKIKALIQKDLDVLDIAKKLNVSRSTILNDLREHGLRTNQQIEREQGLKEAKSAAKKMIDDGQHTTAEIAKETGLSKVTIDNMKLDQKGHPTYDIGIDPERLKKENELWNLALFNASARQNFEAV